MRCLDTAGTFLFDRTRSTLIKTPVCLFFISSFCIFSTGCVGDEPCGPGQKLQGERCVSAKVDVRTDTSSKNDASPKGDSRTDTSSKNDTTLACPFRPTTEQLAGIFTQQGTVSKGTCTPPMPVIGNAFNADVTFALAGTDISVTTKTDMVTITGTAKIEADNRVKTSSKGDVLGITFAIDESLCFSDKDHATADVMVSLSNSAGPLCDFEAPGTFERK